MIQLTARHLLTLPLASLTLALGAPVQAQEAGSPYDECAALADPAERLACFDRTYASERVTLAARRAEAEERRDAEFGFRDAAPDAQAAESDVVSATVAEVLQGDRRSQVVLLDNGQLWREIDGSTMRNRVRAGWTASISRHWSGAYEMRFDGRSGYVRVVRLR